MSVPLAAAFIRLRPQADRGEFAKTGEQMGSAAGKGYGEGFYRDANGKLRQANGRFATDAQKAALEGGRKSGQGFATAMNRESEGTLKKGFRKLSRELGPLLVPLGIGSAVAAIAKIGIQYEDNLNILQSVTKATGVQMDAVARKARELGAATDLPGVSAAGAAEAMTELAKAGFSVQQSMDAAKGTLQLARIAGLSEAKAAEITANAVNAFGLAAKDAGFVTDELAAAANSSSIEVSEASDSFKMAAAVFSGFQGPAIGSKEAITELNTAIAILGNNGIKGSDAGTSLKQMLLQLTGPTEHAQHQMQELAYAAAGANIPLDLQTKIMHGTAKQYRAGSLELEKLNPSLKNVGDIAYDSSGKMRPLSQIIDLVTRGTKDMTQQERNFAITQIFGADAARSVIALMKGGLPAFEAQRKAVLQQGAAASVAAAKNKGLGGAIDNLKGQFENAAIAIYNQVKGPLRTGINGLANVIAPLAGGIEKFGTFVGRNIGTIRDWAIAIGLVTAALRINSLMLAVNGAGGLIAWLKGVRLITGVTRGWAAAQAVLNATLIANPIGIIVVAIGALVGAFVLLFNHNKAFHDLVIRVWGAIRTFIGGVVSWFTGTALPVLTAVWNSIATAVSRMWATYVRPALTALQAYIAKNVTPTVLSLWHNVVQPAFQTIGAIVAVTWNSAVRPALGAWWAFMKNIMIPILLFLWRNVVAPAFKAIGFIIALVIKGILNNFAGMMAILRNVVFPGIRLLLTIVRTVFTGMATAIGKTITTVRGLFSSLAGFVTKTIPDAFRTAVSAIGKAWDAVKRVAKDPVTFVVNHVINPLIGGYNNIAKVFNAPQAPTIHGFARGGQIPGPANPSGRDNMLASITGTGRPIAVASKEFITNTRSTMANLGLMQAINRKRGKVTHEDVDPYLDGYSRGGMVGDGIGDFLGKVWKGLKGAASFVTHPIDGLKRVANAALARIPGGGSMLSLVKNMGSAIVSAVGKKIDSLGAAGGIGGASVLGGYRGMERLIAARFPGLHVISDFRAGAKTLSGNTSYHSLGRAVDYPPVRALAAWIKATFGAKTKELITPWQDLNLHNGRPHTYTGAIWNQHNFAGGNAHVHWAARHGGLVGPNSGMPIKLFDSGGFWPSGTLGANLSGRTEYVQSHPDRMAGTVHIHFHDSVIASETAAEDMIVRGYNAAKRKRRIP